jgi:hypothetical protein
MRMQNQDTQLLSPSEYSSMKINDSKKLKIKIKSSHISSKQFSGNKDNLEKSR